MKVKIKKKKVTKGVIPCQIIQIFWMLTPYLSDSAHPFTIRR